MGREVPASADRTTSSELGRYLAAAARCVASNDQETNSADYPSGGTQAEGAPIVGSMGTRPVPDRNFGGRALLNCD